MLIHEIFESINGEITGSHQGSLCTFIRVSGCNCQCAQCDTKKSQDTSSGKQMKIDEIVKEAERFGNTNITITGGEPLLQIEELYWLLRKLQESYISYKISIETNGSIFIPDWKNLVDSWIADWKCPSSEMNWHMSISNFENLGKRDVIKFVIEDKEDFNYAMEIIRLFKIRRLSLPILAFSPLMGKKGAVLPKELISWMFQEPILKDEGAVFSYQIHKIIGIA